jgi:hypothetical protein
VLEASKSRRPGDACHREPHPVHGLLSIAVGLIYAATVLFLVQLVPVVGGGLSVALSTLAVAALLRPLWRRTQDTVNRRFSGLR